MHYYNKIYAIVTALLILTSCKKSPVAVKKDEVSPVDIAMVKQIAMDFYRSGENGLQNVSDNGVKSASGRGLVVMDNQIKCGQVEKSSVNKSDVKGDTTRTIVGNRIFTYLCDGYFNNNWNIDAYQLQDTVSTTDIGTGFKDIYKVNINYHVRSKDSNYAQLEIDGLSTSDSYKSKILNSEVYEYSKVSIFYKWKKVIAWRTTTGKQPVYLSGEIEFKTSTYDKKGTDVNNNQPSSTSSGYMQPWANNTMRVFFDIPGIPGKTKAYQIDMKTGEVIVLDHINKANNVSVANK